MIFNVGAGGASKAEQVKYDNSKSGLGSDNVQGVVDELQESVNELSDSLANKIIYNTVTGKTDGACLIGVGNGKEGFIPIFAYVISPTTSAQRNVVIQYNPNNKGFYANCVGLASTDVIVGVVYFKA